jgi:redox-sensitive bicupin YhaK (pirin superfamily)
MKKQRQKQTPFYLEIKGSDGTVVHVPVNRAARRATPIYSNGQVYVNAVRLMEPKQGKYTEEELAPLAEEENTRQQAKLARRKYV